ncbi:MAG: RloB domain-containing protein [Prevotella sp.]|nr:RloB domain-containing protein [Prevotella sp.]
MGKQHKTTLILGEGPTEFFYFKSLNDVFRGVTVKPDYPKHTSIKELQLKITDGIAMGYDYIFCVIDMDTKDEGAELSQYVLLKKKYEKSVVKRKNGIHCEVKFFETHRCTELFFLYYFKYTSRMYTDQNLLLKDLNQHCEYHKSKDFFVKCKGLHSYFEKKGGSLDAAIVNAEHSLRDRNAGMRDYTYSELGILMKNLKEL